MLLCTWRSWVQAITPFAADLDPGPCYRVFPGGQVCRLICTATLDWWQGSAGLSISRPDWVPGMALQRQTPLLLCAWRSWV